MAKKPKPKVRKRPTMAETKRLKADVRYLKKYATEVYETARYWTVEASKRLAEIDQMKRVVEDAKKQQWRVINAFNAEKCAAWWQGPVRSRINKGVYLHPQELAAHLTEHHCIVEREWLTDSLCDDPIIAGRITHG